MKLRCRARVSPDCQDGRECLDVYGEDSMRDDGLFDGETVICDACYVQIGTPSKSFPSSRHDVLEHVNSVLAEYKRSGREPRSSA